MAGGEVSASRSLSTSTASTRSSAPASEGRAAAFSDTPAASGRAQDASHPASSAQQPPPSARRPGPQRLGFGAGARAQRVAPLAPSSTASPPRSGQDAVAPTPGAEHSRAMGAVAPGTAANGADGACKGALECPRTAGPRTGGVAGSCTVGNDATAATATRRVAHERSGGRVPLAEVPQGQGGQAARADGGAIKGGGAAGGAGEREGARRGSGAEAGAHPGREEPSVLVNGVRYRVLERVGRGGSCRVYKVVAPNNKILALKRIELDGREQEVAQGFLDEITLLRRLK